MNDILGYLNNIVSYLLSWSGLWVWLVMALIVAAILYIRPHPFWLTDLIYRFPLVGKLARYSTDYAEQVPGGWRNVELTLCHDYARHASSMSREDFNNHIEYLRKAHDLGRRPLPFPALLLVIVLVVFEGLAFAYILGSWIAIESSENQRTVFMLATVAVLAGLLVWLTHAAGHQLYRRKVLRACFRAWKEKRGPHFFSGVMSLSKDQDADDNEPSYVQCANRVAAHHNDFGSYILILLAFLFIAIIAVGATMLRLSTLETSNDADLLANLFGEFGGTPAQGGEGQPDKFAAYVSFAILGTIFVVTQFVAMSFGYRYGFAGRESAAAYDETGGHTSYRSYWRGVQHRMNIANLRLQSLQRRLEQSAAPIDWDKNFLDFVREQIAAGNTNLHEPPAPDQPRPPTQPASAQAEQPNAADNVTSIDRNAG